MFLVKTGFASDLLLPFVHVRGLPASQLIAITRLVSPQVPANLYSTHFIDLIKDKRLILTLNLKPLNYHAIVHRVNRN